MAVTKEVKKEETTKKVVKTTQKKTTTKSAAKTTVKKSTGTTKKTKMVPKTPEEKKATRQEIADVVERVEVKEEKIETSTSKSNQIKEAIENIKIKIEELTKKYFQKENIKQTAERAKIKIKKIATEFASDKRKVLAAIAACLVVIAIADKEQKRMNQEELVRMQEAAEQEQFMTEALSFIESIEEESNSNNAIITTAFAEEYAQTTATLKYNSNKSSYVSTYTAPTGSFNRTPYDNFTSRKSNIKYYQSINSDVKGWIYVPGTNIDYPILQDPNADLSYYLHRDIYKNYDVNGVIWCGPTISFSTLNRFTTIYGHNWNNCYAPIRVAASYDTKFEQLAGYHYISTAQSYPYFYFSTPSQDYCVQIFACFYARPSTFYYWGSNGTQAVVDEAMNRSLHDFHVSVNVSTDKIVTLSTCTRMYPYGSDQKFVVMGKIVSANSITAPNITANTDHWEP